MLVIKWYRYLYYRVYDWRRAKSKTPISDPEIDAALFIAMANILYIVGILFIFGAFSSIGKSFLESIFLDGKGFAYISGVIIALLHLLIYVWSGSWKTIVTEFDKIKERKGKVGTFSVIFYFVFSYIFAILSGLLLLPSIHAQLPQVF